MIFVPRLEIKLIAIGTLKHELPGEGGKDTSLEVPLPVNNSGEQFVGEWQLEKAGFPRLDGSGADAEQDEAHDYGSSNVSNKLLSEKMFSDLP